MNLPNIKWHCNSDDDFVGRCKGYVLRVEVVSDTWVWWCVYYPDGHEHEKEVYVENDFPHAKTINEAVDYAVTTFYCNYISPL